MEAEADQKKVPGTGRGVVERDPVKGDSGLRDKYAEAGRGWGWRR